jgi:small subunit ribosomal protein S6
VLGTVAKKLYEGMFLVDTALAASDWDGTMALIRRTLEKNEAEIVSLRKWEERRLAYDIQGKSRGTYILSYFKCDGGKLTEIERDVQLSEKIMRVLILKAENVTEADMNKETPAMQMERESMPQAAPATPAVQAVAPRTEGPSAQG